MLPQTIHNPLGDDYSRLEITAVLAADLEIARAAWVSRRGAHEGTDDEVTRILRYMINHGHTSPFEMATVKMEVTAPLFVFRQWHRHRTWSYNEESRRYTDSDPTFYTPTSSRGRDSKNKQGSLPDHPLPAELFRGVFTTNEAATSAAYHFLLSEGVAPEVARMVLPVTLYSTMVASVDLHNLLKFIEERSHHTAQWEIRQYSDALYTDLQGLFPIVHKVFTERLLAKGGYPVVTNRS